MTYDIIVIGAGTAGMTAALYALRAGKSVMLLESENFGGQISYTPRIENYPGIKQVSGSEFSSALFDQVTALGAKFDLARVDKVSASSSLDDSGDNCNSYGKNDDNNSKIDDNNNKNRYKTVFAEGKTYRAKAVIIAVGVKPRRLNLPREDELSGEGVCYCAVCDGAFYMGTNVVVAGGGNTALTDALFLSAYCNRVHLVCLDPAFTAEKVLIDRVLARDNIKIMLSHTVTKLLGGGCLDGVEVTDRANGTTRKIDVAALFVAIGHAPKNRAFANVVSLDKEGFIMAENCVTGTAGVFAAGDCRVKKYRQLTTAVSDGATAALLACEYCDGIE